MIALIHQNGITDKDILHDANKLMGYDRNLSAKRNRTIHDPWLMDHVSNEIYRHEVTIDKNTNILRDEFVQSDLQQLLEDIRKQSQRLGSISGRLAFRYSSLICKRWITRHESPPDQNHTPSEK
jgi:hypothetical protein